MYQRLLKMFGGLPVPSAASRFIKSSGTGASDYDWSPLSAADVTSGVFDIARIPIAALERMAVVADQTARYALTTATVQNGDTVLQVSPNNEMYFVIDDTNLGNAAGYQIYNATAVWSSILNKPVIITDIAAITSPSADDVIQYVGGAWVKRSITQLKTSLTLTVNSDFLDVVPTEAGTSTPAAGSHTLVVAPAGALTATTIDLTNYATNGLEVELTFEANSITTLTLSGGTFVGALTTASPGTFAKYRYRTSNTTFYRIG